MRDPGPMTAPRQRLSKIGVAALVVVTAGTALAADQKSPEELYAQNPDWNAPSGGKLNISSFLFHDVNRNGKYDLPDRPLENIAVRMFGPEGRKALRWTNFNGFANFPMSMRHKGGVINTGGEYRFDVQVPPGWSTTTGLLSQTLSFREMPGAYADIVGYPPFKPVGLVQDLYVKGRVVLPGNGKPKSGKVTGKLVGPDGRNRPVEISEDGQFREAITAGKWRLSIDVSGNEQVERAFTVRNVPVQLSAIRVGEMQPEPLGKQQVIDFETVTPRGISEIPNGAGGLDWWNMIAYRVKRAYANNSVSGNYVAYNSSGHPARISHPKGFDFAGSYFGVAWKQANGETLTLKAWRGETLLHEDEITLSDLGPVWFEADYRGITRLDLVTRRHWQFVTDDMAFRLTE